MRRIDTQSRAAPFQQPSFTGHEIFDLPHRAQFAGALVLPMMLLAILEIMIIRYRVRKEVSRRWPEESLKGVTAYAVMRAMNMRWMRLPKPQVRIGEPLPDTYR